MSRHVLSLEVPDTLNKCIFRVVDTSVYDPNIAVTCPLLQITLPGFIHPVNFSSPQITPGFIANLTACDLGIQVAECNTVFFDIPDGIYIIKYSVEPKEYVFVEYNHLRVTCALNRLNKVRCAINLGPCEPSTDVLQKLQQIGLIEQYIKAAKAYVEDCHDPKRGMELYSYAVKLIDKLTCSTGCETC